ELNLIDDIIEEPLGGAHRDPADMAARVKAQLLEQLEQLGRLPVDQLIAARYQRLMTCGEYLEK
ncbi:MAG: acetyl-CoA carboxylase carboxyl transferase subunit alpha, partial [Gammaproteobacteria bacterium]